MNPERTIRSDRMAFDVRYAIERYGQGATLQQIGREMRYDPTTVRYHLTRKGIMLRRAGRKRTTKVDEQELKRLYLEEGLGRKAVAKRLRISGGTVSRRLFAMGILRGCDKRIIPREEVIRCRREYALGITTVDAVAEELGVAQDTARKMLRRMTYRDIP